MSEPRDPRHSAHVVSKTGEPRHQQLARNLSELLGELRVAQAGVQILFGFQLAVAFTVEFREADGVEKSLYLVTVLFTTAAGVVFRAWQRWSGHLVTPMLLHAATNSLGALVAWWVTHRPLP